MFFDLECCLLMLLIALFGLLVNFGWCFIFVDFVFSCLSYCLVVCVLFVVLRLRLLVVIIVFVICFVLFGLL